MFIAAGRGDNFYRWMQSTLYARISQRFEVLVIGSRSLAPYFCMPATKNKKPGNIS